MAQPPHQQRQLAASADHLRTQDPRLARLLTAPRYYGHPYAQSHTSRGQRRTHAATLTGIAGLITLTAGLAAGSGQIAHLSIIALCADAWAWDRIFDL
ncbi:DUF3040 domain-containing protein [Streptomyces sp. UG1]|uniref:DUF3040 domain-containing protein n=1 Tax=Streptomyces sp. UG1 TaxID=3417652 RepID=UPI003CE93131